MSSTVRSEKLLRRRFHIFDLETQSSDREDCGESSPGKFPGLSLRRHSCALCCLLLASGDCEQSAILLYLELKPYFWGTFRRCHRDTVVRRTAAVLWKEAVGAEIEPGSGLRPGKPRPTERFFRTTDSATGSAPPVFAAGSLSQLVLGSFRSRIDVFCRNLTASS